MIFDEVLGFEKAQIRFKALANARIAQLARRFAFGHVGEQRFVGERFAGVSCQGYRHPSGKVGVKIGFACTNLEQCGEILCGEITRERRVDVERGGPASLADEAGEASDVGFDRALFEGSLEKASQGNRLVGISAFGQAHGAHVQAGDAARAAMGNLPFVHRGRAGEDELPLLVSRRIHVTP